MSPEVVREVKIERVGAFHFQVHGAMTFESAKILLLQSEALFATLPEMEIDLAGVEKVDSAGLALMLEWTAWAKERNAKLMFTAVPESIHSIAHLCQIESLLDGKIAQTDTNQMKYDHN
jgi:phospholipid transport system transporter-binding protein